MKGILGKPKYKIGDDVEFSLSFYNSTDSCLYSGKVYIVDAYGTFDQNEEPSYDIMVENFDNSGQQCLVKHIRESICNRIF